MGCGGAPSCVHFPEPSPRLQALMPEAKMALICGVISSGQSRQLGHLYPPGPPPSECLGDCTPPCPRRQAAGTALRSWMQLGHSPPIHSVLGVLLRASRGQQRGALGGGCTGQAGPRPRWGAGPQKEPATVRWRGSQARLWAPGPLPGLDPGAQPPHTPHLSRAALGPRAPRPRASLKGLPDLGPCASSAWSWSKAAPVSGVGTPAGGTRSSLLPLLRTACVRPGRPGILGSAGAPSDSHTGRGWAKPRLLPAR